MSCSIRPVLIFVHGAWHNSSCFSKLLTELEHLPSPYRCIAVDLPSVGSSASCSSRKTWQPDIDAIRNAIDAEVSQGRRVLLVSHSYGSIPSQEAVKEFSASGMITQLIIAGFLLDVGESISCFNNTTLPPNPNLQEDYYFCLEPARLFYNDIPEIEQASMVAQLQHQTTVTKTSKVTCATWKRIPTTYLVCERDRALTPDKQVFMVKRATDGGAIIAVEVCDSGHLPFVSMPGTVVEIIRRMSGER